MKNKRLKGKLMHGRVHNKGQNTEADRQCEGTMEVCPQLQRNYHLNLLAQKIFLLPVQQGTNLHSNLAFFALIVRKLKEHTLKTGEGTPASSFGSQPWFWNKSSSHPHLPHFWCALQNTVRVHKLGFFSLNWKRSSKNAPVVLELLMGICKWASVSRMPQSLQNVMLGSQNRILGFLPYRSAPLYYSLM